MAINAGTVAAYLTLDTKQYTAALLAAQQQMMGFANQTDAAKQATSGFRTAAASLSDVFTVKFATQIQGTATSLGGLSEKYENMFKLMTNQMPIAVSISNFAKLSTEVSEAAKQISILNAAFANDTNEMLNRVTENRRETLRVWVADYMTHSFEMAILLAQESDMHCDEASKRLLSYESMYGIDVLNFGNAEESKTEIEKKETARREKILKDSMENNKNALKSYVAVFAGIGTEYGEALLSGIQSTSSRILAYLNSLASAVRSATEGGTPTFSGYETCTNSALSGLAVVGESGKPEIVDFSGGEQVIAFNESVAMMGRAASEAMAYSQAVENIVTSLASEGSYGQAGYMSRAEEPYGMAGERGGGLVYSPTYISPVEASIDELMMKDQIMMRRLGLSY